MIQEELKIHDQEITNIYEADTNPNKLKAEKINEYRTKHPEYVELEQERDKLENIVNNIKSRIQDYNTFATTLQQCYQRIDDKVLMCA